MEQRHLIKTTEDLQGFTRINLSVLQGSFLPYEVDARQKYILRYLGENLHEEILYLYHSGLQTFPTWADTQVKKDILLKVLYYAQNALAKFTLFLAAPHLDLHLSEMGFVVTHTDTTAPASAERVRTAVKAYLAQGYDNLETLLRFLEKHHGDIDSYSESEAFSLANSNLINSAEQFDRLVSIGGSRMRFIELRPVMDNIEKLVIEPLISTAQADAIRQEMKEGNLSPANKKLLDLIRRAVANLVVAEAWPFAHPDGSELPGNSASVVETKDRLSGYGKNYLAWIKQTLDKDPDQYPQYKQSPQYAVNRSYAPYENTDDPENRIFVFGQP